MKALPLGVGLQFEEDGYLNQVVAGRGHRVIPGLGMRVFPVIRPQNAQNRDSQAIQLKLNELLRSSKGAHTALLDIEELSEEELDKLKGKYEELASFARDALRKGQTDLGSPEVRVNIPFRKTGKDL